MVRRAAGKNGVEKLKTKLKNVLLYLQQDKGQQPMAILFGITAPLLVGAMVLESPWVAGLAMAGCFYLLTETSDTVVDHATAMGKKIKMAPIILGIGLGLLTGLPELFVSGAAMLQDNPALGIGNVLGSNVANILLVLGLTAIVTKVKSKNTSWMFNVKVLIATTFLFAAALVLGRLPGWIGILFLGGTALYAFASYRHAKAAHEPAPEEVTETHPEDKLDRLSNILFGLAGLFGLVGAATAAVTAASAFGLALGISPVIIGTLAVALGTSLPELAVNLKSALKGDADMALGNILGSNIFNILLVGGTIATGGLFLSGGAAVPVDLNPLKSPLGVVNMAAFAGAAAVLVFFLKTGKGELTRHFGITALVLYAVYTIGSFLLNPG